MITDVTGILLAGGKSQRMGEDKRFLSVGSRTLFESSLSTLGTLFEQIYVVIAQDSPALETEAQVLRDLVPNCGSLGGLYTGLQQAGTRHIFIAACDMPFLNPVVIRYMVALKDSADIVMAQWKNRLHPTHAIYSRRCLPIIERMLQSHNVKIQGMLADPSVHVRLVSDTELGEIDPDGRSFLNINTPADLEMARSLGGHRSNPE